MPRTEADDEDGRQPGRPGRPFALQMHFQPVVDLGSLVPVGYEALARDTTSGVPRPPDALFSAARGQGRLGELDWACRTAALQGSRGLRPGSALFVNTDPAAAGITAPAAYRQAELAASPAVVRVLEVTERAVARRPGPLLAMVDAARRAGWRIALDDVGAQAASLSLMPFLRPDVIKLDLRLVQERTTVQAAEVVNAVAVQATRTGAVVLAEGIETAEHVDIARSMGASLGQGHLLGRPAPLPPVPVAGAFAWPRTSTRPAPSGTPWQQLPPGAPVRRATKPLLVAVSRWLERQAAALGEPAVLLATFEQARHFTPGTARRYAGLAGGATIVGAFGQQLSARPAEGVRGVDLRPDDPLCAEWNVLVLGPHFAGALLSHDVGDGGPDAGRRFDYTVTYDREQVLAAAEPLLRRLPDLPDLPDPARNGSRHDGERPTIVLNRGVPRAPVPDDVSGIAPELVGLLGSALAASSNGVAICDAALPDLPLLYVNPAFARLSGYSAAELLGRNARFLQCPDTDPEAVAGLRAALQAGREVRATLLNQRPDGSRWWNEMNLVPVRDHQDAVTHWVGTQNDVTDRMEAERQVAYLAYHDALTGLANRRRLSEHLPAEIGRASRTGTTVALLYLDLDGFKRINDTHGHDTGDRLLAAIATRLAEHVRVGDLLVRQGGDEFLVVLSGLPGPFDVAARSARQTADKLRAELHAPFELDGDTAPLSTGVSIGISLWPHHAVDGAQLLEQADAALYLVKAGGRDGTLLHGEVMPAEDPLREPPVRVVDVPDGGVAAAAALRRVLTDGEEIQQAVGLLMGRSGLGAAEALEQLTELSREQDRPLDQAARDLLRDVDVTEPAR